jgi:hypothetical protein
VAIYSLFASRFLGYGQSQLSAVFSAGAATTIATQIFIVPRLVKSTGEHLSLICYPWIVAADYGFGWNITDPGTSLSYDALHAHTGRTGHCRHIDRDTCRPYTYLKRQGGAGTEPRDDSVDACWRTDFYPPGIRISILEKLPATISDARLFAISPKCGTGFGPDTITITDCAAAHGEEIETIVYGISSLSNTRSRSGSFRWIGVGTRQEAYGCRRV